MADESGLLQVGPRLDVGQVAKVLQRPEHEGPVGGQRRGADQDREDRRPPHRAAEQVQDAGRCLLCLLFGRVPLFRLRHGAANPQDQQGRQDADQEHAAVGIGLAGGRDDRDQHARDHRQQHADIDRTLQDGGNPRPPAAGPSLGQQRRAHRPLAADAQRRQEAANHQLPPRLRKERQPGEQRVSQDGQDQRPRPSQPIAKPAEESAAQGPTDQKRRLDHGAVVADGVVRLTHLQQLGDERRGDQRVQVHVQAVEQPTQPGGNA